MRNFVVFTISIALFCGCGWKFVKVDSEEDKSKIEPAVATAESQQSIEGLPGQSGFNSTPIRKSRDGKWLGIDYQPEGTRTIADLSDDEIKMATLRLFEAFLGSDLKEIISKEVSLLDDSCSEEDARKKVLSSLSVRKAIRDKTLPELRGEPFLLADAEANAFVDQTLDNLAQMGGVHFGEEDPTSASISAESEDPRQSLELLSKAMGELDSLSEGNTKKATEIVIGAFNEEKVKDRITLLMFKEVPNGLSGEEAAKVALGSSDVHALVFFLVSEKLNDPPFNLSDEAVILLINICSELLYDLSVAE